MKWEDLNWKVILLGVATMMILMYVMGCNHCNMVNHSCPEDGHGPCFKCDEV